MTPSPSGHRVKLSAREEETISTAYDLLVYHDFTDPTDTPLQLGDSASKLGFPPELQVVAIGPGVHEGRTTVVLAHGFGPMPRMQALLDQPGDF